MCVVYGLDGRWIFIGWVLDGVWVIVDTGHSRDMYGICTGHVRNRCEHTVSVSE